MFKRGTISWAIWNFVVAALLIAGGVLSIAFSNNADFQNVVILIVGIFIVVDAALRLFVDVFQIFHIGKGVAIRTDLVQAAAAASELSAGIILIFIANNLATASAVFQYLGLFLGILLVTLGAIGALYGIVFIVRKVKPLFYSILGLIVTALLIGGGIAVIVLIGNNSQEAQARVMQIFLIFFGIILAFIGVALCVGTITLLRAAKRVLGPLEEEASPAPAVEAEVEEEKPAEPEEEKPEEAPEEKPEDEKAPEEGE